MPDTFSHDVFISYSSQDKDWVRGVLVPGLEKAGLTVCIDYRDFTAGRLSRKNCEDAVLQSRKTLLILTPDWVKSEWCELEHVVGSAGSPVNTDLRVIPLRKARCEPPLMIRAMTHIDFTDTADPKLAWKQLMVALGSQQDDPGETVTPSADCGDWFLDHPYAMAPHFTGRKAERYMLSGWLASDAEHPLLVLRALGGFGKSALTWQWLLKDVDPKVWPRVVWWSFYEADASFEAFLENTLGYLTGKKVDRSQLGGKDAVALLLKLLRQPGTLLVLDGFEREMKAFGGMGAAYQGDDERPEDRGRECMSPLADLFLNHLALKPGFKAKVLLTTRLRPQVLEAKGGTLLTGCLEEKLRQMQPADAVAFFHALGIRGTRAEIEGACANYGYHPLSLRLLAGVVVGNFQQPGDIVATGRLDVSGDLVQRQHHVLEASYDGLTPAQQTLLGYIACLRSLVSYEVMQALAKGMRQSRGKKGSSAKPAASTSSLDADLRDLMARGLLNHDPKTKLFDLHPIVRRYAYDRLAAPARAAAHTRLRDYFAAVPKVEKVTCLDELTPLIELFHHTIRAGQMDEAFELYRDRLFRVLYHQMGAYGLMIDLLRPMFVGEEYLPRLKSAHGQALASLALAASFAHTGQPHAAMPLFARSIAGHEIRGEEYCVAIRMNTAALSQIAIGKLREAERHLLSGVEVSRRDGSVISEARCQRDLGWLLAVRGNFLQASTELEQACAILENESKSASIDSIKTSYASNAWGNYALHGLLQLRSSKTKHSDPAPQALSFIMDHAQRAMALARKTAEARLSQERSYARSYWLLGAACQVCGRPTEADKNLGQALERCRRINLVESEAEILIALARLRTETGDIDEAQRLAEEALSIADRCGYVLAGADAHLELAKLALGRGERDVARTHAQEARKLATCDGPPDYTYKAAYDEAGELIKQLQV